MNASEANAVLTIAMMAAFADGENSDVERAALRRMTESFGRDCGVDLTSIYYEVLARRPALRDVAATLPTGELRSLAYELARGVCEADGSINEREQAFLQELRGTLNLPATGAPAGSSATASAAPDAQPPLLVPVNSEAIDKLVLDNAILCGALEILPHRLATMAIVPLQMRMVYRIGQNYGYTLDRGHIREFLGTLGLGLASQAVESVARDVMRGLARRVLGGFGGALVGAVAGGAMGFAGTYAIGELAKQHYSGGRVMSSAVLRTTYQNLLAEGQSLFGRHAGAVQARASTLSAADVITLARSPA